MTEQEEEIKEMAHAEQVEKDYRGEEEDDEYQAPIHDEFGIGVKIITVSKDAKMKAKKGEEFIELCNDDLASGFYNHNTQCVIRVLASLCADLCELTESYRLPILKDGKITGWQSVDMSSVYNMIARKHNHLIISSKGLEGQAAAMSRSHIAISKGTRSITRSEGDKKGGGFPLKIRGSK